jgi:DNA-binding MarR family transcriptional regulator
MARTKSAARPKRRRETAPRTGAFGLGLENLIGYNLRRAHGVQKSRFSAVFGPLGIRPVTLSLLGTVYDHPGIAQTELGKRLHIKRANMVPLLAELSARGLIVRRPSKTDRRAQLVDLTEAGKTLTAELLALHQKLEADLVLTLGERESAQLLELLLKFRELSQQPDLVDNYRLRRRLSRPKRT